MGLQPTNHSLVAGRLCLIALTMISQFERFVTFVFLHLVENPDRVSED